MVIFDQRVGLEPIEDRISTEERMTEAGRTILVPRGSANVVIRA